MVVTFKQMTIKHSMYMQKVPFLCTERPVWFFSGFGISPRRKVTWSKVLQVLQTRGSTLLYKIVGVAVLAFAAIIHVQLYRLVL